MGYARIISGGEDGRYRIELDYGNATRLALLTAINGVIAKIDAALNTLAVKIADAEAQEAELVELVRQAALVELRLCGTLGGHAKRIQSHRAGGL